MANARAMGRHLGGRWARRCLLSAAVGITAGAAAAPAGAALADAEVDITAGVDGSRAPDDPILVRVWITADSLIDGEIITTSESSNLTTRRDVQIPAGTTKVFDFVVPTVSEAGEVEVTVLDGSDVVGTRSVSAGVADAREFVGVLPRLAAQIGELPRSVSLVADLGDARFAALTPEVIDLGSQALRVFDVIVAGAGDLASLDEGQRADVLGWVSAGGTLLIDDEASLADVPIEWQPGAAGYAWAELGEVRFTDGAAVGGRWSTIIQPTPDGGSGGMTGSEMMLDPQVSLASRAGLELPSIAPLAIGLGLYALVLGPVVYLVLRRLRRLTLAWVAIPVLAAVTAGVVIVAGRDSLRGGHETAATLIQQGPAGGFAIANALTLASDGGADIELPAGWAPQPPSPYFWSGDSAPLTLTLHPDGSSSGRVALEATQASFRTYAGPEALPGLTTSATLGPNDTIVGAVRNDSPIPMHAVAVFAGNDQVLLGDLAPGGSAEWTLDAPDSLALEFGQRGGSVWGLPENIGFGPGGPNPNPNSEPLVDQGLWGSASMTIDLFPTGYARVVGWTDAVPSPLVGSNGTTTTAVTSLAPVVSDAGVLNAATVRAVVVRGGWSRMGPATQQVVRYLLPAGADPSGLVLTGLGAAGISEVSFWDGTQWLAADVGAVGGVALPAAAIRDGVILVTTDLDPQRGPAGMPTLVQGAP